MIQSLNSSFYFSLLLKYRFNWGLCVKNLSEKVLKLLESETLHKEERARASKLTHRIERFGSFVTNPLQEMQPWKTHRLGRMEDVILTIMIINITKLGFQTQAKVSQSRKGLEEQKIL